MSLRIVGAEFGVLAVVALGGYRLVHAKSLTCLDSMAWRGEAEAVATTRVALGRGMLAQAPAAACEGVEIEVHRLDGGFRYALRRGPRSVEHASKDLTAMKSWIESWLAPSIPLPIAHDKEAPPFAPPGPRTKSPQLPPRPRIPLQLAVRAVVDLDHLGPAWPGVELAVAVALSRAVWLGVAGCGSWAPERDFVERRALRISVQAGWLSPLSWGALRLGGGVGVVSASARREIGADREIGDDDAGPYLEAVGLLDVDLGAHWVLSLGGGVRVFLPDDLGSGDGGQPEGPTDALELSPLPAVSGTLQLGIAWHNGWTR